MKRAQVLLFALAAGCGGGSSESSGPQATECELPSGVVAQCTSIEVAENPDAPEVRTLSLSVAVVPAREPEGRPPAISTTGGPGQGAQSSYGAAIRAFDAVRDHHDLVLLDQRGTGSSHPLNCADTQVLDLKQAVSLEIDGPRLEACRDAQDADLSQYTTARAIDDLAHVLATLGYTKSHLVGGSYGTRVALAFARAYPEQTASIVIDGVAPPDFALPVSFAKDAEAAMDAMVRDLSLIHI